MTTMIRKQIYLESRQEARLKEAAEETGQSEAEIIRAALMDWLEAKARKQRALEAWQSEKTFIQSLLAQGAVEGGRTWTREAIYEERVNRYGADSD